MQKEIDIVNKREKERGGEEKYGERVHLVKRKDKREGRAQRREVRGKRQKQRERIIVRGGQEVPIRSSWRNNKRKEKSLKSQQE